MSRSADDATLGDFLRPRGPIQLTLTTRHLENATLIEVGGELDVLTVPRLTRQLNEIVRRDDCDVVLDLDDTEFIDSLGLHALLTIQRRLTRRGRRLTVVCGEGPARRTIALARLTDSLNLVSSLAEYELRQRP